MVEIDISSMSPVRELLAGRVVWNVNSTARGVAELHESLVGRSRVRAAA